MKFFRHISLVTFATPPCLITSSSSSSSFQLANNNALLRITPKTPLTPESRTDRTELTIKVEWFLMKNYAAEHFYLFFLEAEV
jgi:hypothetical protein